MKIEVDYQDRPVERMTLLAHQFMSSPAVSVGPTASVAEVAQIMAEKRVGCVLVVDREGKLCGVVTQSDFGGDNHAVPFSIELLLEMFSRALSPSEFDRIRNDARSKTAEDIMVTEVHSGEEETPVEELARLMLRYDIDHIPIVRDGMPVGLVARHDFLRMVATDEQCR